MTGADRYLLLLGAHMPLRERVVVAAARVFAGPLAVLVPEVPPRDVRAFDLVVPGDPFDPESALRGVAAVERATGRTPAAVVPLVDPAVPTGLAVAERYGLPYLSADAVRCSSVNKQLMKERLLAKGVPTPRFRTFTDLASLRAAIGELGLPCVLKPSGFGGSMGVVLVPDADAVEAGFAYVKATFDENWARFSIRNHCLQVEEFCDLPFEVSVEVLNGPGRRVVLAVTDKALSPPPFFAEMGHRVPSVHTGNEAVVRSALDACAALGLDRGVAHVELRTDGAGRAEIVEVGARTAGDGILDLVERAYGLSPYEWHIRSYLGDPSWPDLPPARGVAALAVLKAPEGWVTAITEPTAADPAVIGYGLFAGVGEASARAECYEQREGYVELYWPGARPAEVPPDAHLVIARALATDIVRVDPPQRGKGSACTPTSAILTSS